MSNMHHKNMARISQVLLTVLNNVSDYVNERQAAGKPVDPDKIRQLLNVVFNDDRQTSFMFIDYEKLARETMLAQCNSLNYAILGLVGEAGELANKYKKVIRGDVKPSQFEEWAKEELGDILWYLSSCCDLVGTCLNEVARINIDKLISRKNRGVIAGSGDNR